MPYEIMHSHMSEGPREVWPSIRRGFRSRCPACGTGRLFTRFLKVRPVCEHCGEELFHERADDFPPYITMSIVAHVVLMGIVLVEQHADWSMTQHLLVWPALTIALSFLLMQPVKGAVVGYQWAKRMHGFEGSDEAERRPSVAKTRDKASG